MIKSMITTDRLSIRPFEQGDAMILFHSINESREHLSPWMPWTGHLRTVESTREYISHCMKFSHTKYYLMFDVKQNLIGGLTILYHPWKPMAEIGYWVDINYTKKGYATEAALALMRHAFGVSNVTTIQIMCEVANVQSNRIPERLDFSKTFTGSYGDLTVNVWEITKLKFEKLHYDNKRFDRAASN